MDSIKDGLELRQNEKDAAANSELKDSSENSETVEQNEKVESKDKVEEDKEIK